ncbi:hypothetical protein [Defluviimonas sp. SAOS-178_SWC]|uniref:hypothetical protein n=1 Tax=Defluviimonas sp. SAOS-178_SWC TaxID=3121287 RepID=UPI0032220EEA
MSAHHRICRAAPGSFHAFAGFVRSFMRIANRSLTVFPVLEMLGLAGLILLLAR